MKIQKIESFIAERIFLCLMFYVENFEGSKINFFGPVQQNRRVKVVLLINPSKCCQYLFLKIQFFSGYHISNFRSVMIAVDFERAYKNLCSKLV